MRKAKVFLHNKLTGFLMESDDRTTYKFEYLKEYAGRPISLTMPVKEAVFVYRKFPPFFDGVLPEGIMLDGLLRQLKIDKNDYFSQLLAVGEDLVGAVTVKPIADE